MIDAIATRRPPSQAPAHGLERTPDEHLRESRDYQILRRTLGIDQPVEPLASDAVAPTAEEPGVDPELQAAQASASVARFEQVLQQRDLSVQWQAEPQPQVSDPLVLDLAGNGFSTRGLENALDFDLDADGRRDRISAPSGDDALLALDRDGNGRIDDGRELFGDQNGAANGFAELARYDDNADGRIDASDAIYRRLTLLRFDAQGRQQQQSLAEAGVAAIQLKARDVDLALGAYDRIAQLGSFEFADGRQGQAADLLLAHR